MEREKKRRRQRGEGSLFQRSQDGLWIGVIDLGYIGDASGKRKRRRITVSAKTQAAAIAKLNEKKRQYAMYGDLPTGGMTVEQWLDYWTTHVAASKPQSQRFYRYMASLITPILGPRRLDKLQPQHVRALHDQLYAKRRIVKNVAVPLSQSTIRHAHTTLVTALNDAMKEGQVVRNVAKLVDPPRSAVSSRGALTATEARTLLRHVVDDRLSARWMTALLLGARQGECLGLTWDRVDLANRRLDFAWQLQHIYYRHGCGDPPTCGQKRGGHCPHRQLDVRPDYEHVQLHNGLCLVRPKSTAGVRIVPIPASLLAALNARHDAYLVERDGYIVDHGLVWARPDGRPIQPSQDNREWDAVCKAAGVSDVPLHAARHTTATLLMEAGEDAKVIQAIVGHSAVTTTRGYQHVSTEFAAAALDRLDTMLQIEG